MISDYYTESVSRMTRSTASAWNTETAWSTSASVQAFDAAVNPISGVERIAGGRTQLMADYKMFCSDTVTLTEKDRVKWGSKTFDVVFVKDTLDMGHHKKVLLKELNG